MDDHGEEDRKAYELQRSALGSLERRILAVVEADGVITKAALYDLFVPRGASYSDCERAALNLLYDGFIANWPRISKWPPDIEKRVNEGLRHAIFDHHERDDIRREMGGNSAGFISLGRYWRRTLYGLSN